MYFVYCIENHKFFVLSIFCLSFECINTVGTDCISKESLAFVLFLGSLLLDTKKIIYLIVCNLWKTMRALLWMNDVFPIALSHVCSLFFVNVFSTPDFPFLSHPLLEGRLHFHPQLKYQEIHQLTNHSIHLSCEWKTIMSCKNWHDYFSLSTHFHTTATTTSIYSTSSFYPQLTARKHTTSCCTQSNTHRDFGLLN